jgi:hypothetical protein
MVQILVEGSTCIKLALINTWAGSFNHRPYAVDSLSQQRIQGSGQQISEDRFLMVFYKLETKEPQPVYNF